LPLSLSMRNVNHGHVNAGEHVAATLVHVVEVNRLYIWFRCTESRLVEGKRLVVHTMAVTVKKVTHVQRPRLRVAN
jgi:hypothetical protein